ncbi:hypothetical protein LMG24235_08297 [Paraburkholderia sabiae]|nr:hypothetical protein LMG24235_08297 [Paraburkholderia sabiae]
MTPSMTDTVQVGTMAIELNAPSAAASSLATITRKPRLQRAIRDGPLALTSVAARSRAVATPASLASEGSFIAHQARMSRIRQVNLVPRDPLTV